MSHEKTRILCKILEEGHSLDLPPFKLSELYIDHHKFDEDRLSQILQVVGKMDTLKVVSLKNVTIGRKSTDLLKAMFEKAYPSNVDELLLEKITFEEKDRNENLLFELIESLSLNVQIRVLKLRNLNLNDEYIADQLYNLITENTVLREVRFDRCEMGLNTLDYAVQGLHNNKGIQSISLQGIQDLFWRQVDYDGLNTALGYKRHGDRWEKTEEILENLQSTISQSVALIHLDLSDMFLKYFVLDIVKAVR